MSVLEEIARARAERVRALEALDPIPEPSPVTAPHAYLEAVRRAPGTPIRLIAEVKRAAPSAGVLRDALDGAAAVRAYEAGGAAAISVVTEEERFGGSTALFRECRGTATRPVLWKDFVVSDYQMRLARREGADAILLIAALAGDRLGALVERALTLGLEPLVEVHDAGEARRATESPARVIGINNRDLATLRVDLATTERLAPLLSGRVVVAESGVEAAADLERLAGAGADAALVGSSLMRQDDLEAAVRRLLGGTVS